MPQVLAAISLSRTACMARPSRLVFRRHAYSVTADQRDQAQAEVARRRQLEPAGRGMP